jgi:hypothetical protein
VSGHELGRVPEDVTPEIGIVGDPVRHSPLRARARRRGASAVDLSRDVEGRAAIDAVAVVMGRGPRSFLWPIRKTANSAGSTGAVATGQITAGWIAAGVPRPADARRRVEGGARAAQVDRVRRVARGRHKATERDIKGVLGGLMLPFAPALAGIRWISAGSSGPRPPAAGAPRRAPLSVLAGCTYLPGTVSSIT